VNVATVSPTSNTATGLTSTTLPLLSLTVTSTSVKASVKASIFKVTPVLVIAQNYLFLCIIKSPEPHLNQRFRAFLYS